MDKARFDEYIARFNQQDLTAFDDFIAPDLTMVNGTLPIEGREGMKHHYRDLIWPDFVERLTVPRFVSSDANLAIQMHTDFTARADKADSLFGPVKQGDRFAFDGLIMYDIDENGQFGNICVAYNSFVYTSADGSTSRDLGIPH